MRYLVSCLIVLFCGVSLASAQNYYNVTPDSTTYAKPALADSSLVGVSIFSVLKQHDGVGSVSINQPSEIQRAYASYINANRNKKHSGYRIRLFFDNKQSARNESENVVNGFKENFPYIPVYRSYSNPFFKVVVGDYRTKSDAMKALQVISQTYPKAIIVKDQIGFPAI